MNKEIIEIIKKRNIHPIGYEKNGNIYIIQDKEKRYALKLNTSNYDIYKYLLSRDFHNYPNNYNFLGDNYDLSLYIPDIKIDKEQKLNDLIDTMSLLHKKTSYKREIDLDDIKNIYEDILKKINSKMIFYTNINDFCDSRDFLSPYEYLLVRNISLVYYLLNYARNNINVWYDKIKKEKSIRVCLLHNNISLDHFIVNQNKYLINWDKAMFDNSIYDIISFYKLYYKDFALNDVFLIYEKRYPLEDIEKELLLIYLIIGNNIEFGNNELLNVKTINNELIYLKKIYDYIKYSEKR